MEALAFILLISSLIFNGILFVSEEALMKKFELHPCELLGSEGV